MDLRGKIALEVYTLRQHAGELMADNKILPKLAINSERPVGNCTAGT